MIWGHIRTQKKGTEKGGVVKIVEDIKALRRRPVGRPSKMRSRTMRRTVGS